MDKLKSGLLFVLFFIIASTSVKMIGKNYFNDHKNEALSDVDVEKNKSVVKNVQTIDIEKAMLDFVNTANQQLPAMIDKDTRLDSVFCDKKNFVIKYTLVNLELAKIDVSKADQFLKEKVSKNICMQEDIKKFLELGVGYYFTYFDKNSDFVTKFYINKNTCVSNIIVDETVVSKISEETWLDNSGTYFASFPQHPDSDSLQLESGVVKGYSCNEKIRDSYIMYLITEYPKYKQNNRKLAEMTIQEYMNTLKNIKVLKQINWNNYSKYEDRVSYEFSYNFKKVNATEKGFMTIYNDNMVRVSFTYIGNNEEAINKGNNFLKSFKFVE
jgi:hypothetical protein